MELNDSDTDDMEPEWKKLERNMAKVGLKNGLSDGRDSNFQKSFDKGYTDGFQNGFDLGKLKFQRSIYKNLVTAETADLLENASKGMCVVCTSEKENENVDDVRKKQTELFDLSVKKIKVDLNR